MLLGVAAFDGLARCFLCADRAVAFAMQGAAAPLQADVVDFAPGELRFHRVRTNGAQGHATVLGVGEAALSVAGGGDRQRQATIDLRGRDGVL